jgi:hypothetical protein
VQNNDYFGEQVVLADENTIVVQALHHDIDGYGRSTLYVYRYRDEAWTLTSRFTPSDPGDGFGQLSSSSLAAEGGKIVTGAALDDQIGSNAGAAFYFDIGCDGDIDGDGMSICRTWGRCWRVSGWSRATRGMTRGRMWMATAMWICPTSARCSRPTSCRARDDG